MQAPRRAAPGGMPWVPLALVGLAVWEAFAAEVFAGLDLLGGTQGAWEVVTYGIASAALWLPWCAIMCLVLADGGLARRSAIWLGRVATWWGFLEALMRAASRPMFPMDRAPQTGGQDMCDAATGLPVSWLSVAVALGLAYGVQLLADAMRAGGHDDAAE